MTEMNICNLFIFDLSLASAVTFIAPTIDISLQKAVSTTQQCRQNVIKKLKSNKNEKLQELVKHLKFSYSNILIMEKYWKFSRKI